MEAVLTSGAEDHLIEGLSFKPLATLQPMSWKAGTFLSVQNQEIDSILSLQESSDFALPIMGFLRRRLCGWLLRYKIRAINLLRHVGN